MRYKVKTSTNEDMIQRIFENRNIPVLNRELFFAPSSDCVKSPSIYANMEDGCNLLMKHIKEENLILFIVDADTDGYCSAAMGINYLRLELCYKNITYIMHEQKKHGLTKPMMEYIGILRPSLVVLADAGSNDYKQHKELKDMGIDILVIDHHECDKYSEDAVVINNQLVDDGNKTLSGGGMMLKFLEYLDNVLCIKASKTYRDLAALSLVADGMWMTELETRYYVLEGIKHIKNPFLKTLITKEIDNPYKYLAFQVSPLINATIRVGTMKDKRDLFECMLHQEREEFLQVRGQGEVKLPLGEYVVKKSERLRAKQTREINKILNSEDTIIIEDGYPFVVLIHTNTEAQSLSGLIASKIADIYKKPAIVLREQEHDGKLMYTGSGRSIKGVNDFKTYLSKTDKFDKCEGHQSAFGVKIYADKLQELLTEYIGKDIPLNTKYEVDKEYIDEPLSVLDIMTVDSMKPYWSNGFEEPKFFIKLSNVRSTDINLIGANKNTIKISYDGISYVKFKCDENEIKELLQEGLKTVEVIGSFNINCWNGRQFPQVIVEDFEITSNKEFEDVGAIYGFNPFLC